MIIDIRYDDPEEYENVCVGYFDFEYPGKEKRIKLVKSTPCLWYGYWCEQQRKIDYSVKRFNFEMVSFLCLLYLT